MRGDGIGPNSRQTRGAASRPARNARRHPESSRGATSSPPSTLLIPAMRPLTSANIAAAMPMSTPPASEDHGVKWVQSMFISTLAESVYKQHESYADAVRSNAKQPKLALDQAGNLRRRYAWRWTNCGRE